MIFIFIFILKFTSNFVLTFVLNFVLLNFFFCIIFLLDLLDLEDIGVAMRKQKHSEKKAKEANLRLEARDGGREMVTKLQRRALTKEGYRIIGTHSAVKLCRWTKVNYHTCFVSYFY